MSSQKNNYSALKLSPEVQNVLQELKRDQTRSNRNLGALGKRVNLNTKSIAVSYESNVYEDKNPETGEEITAHVVVFSEPLYSQKEPLFLRIAKQEKDLN